MPITSVEECNPASKLDSQGGGEASIQPRIAQSVAFTEAHRAHRNEHHAVREAMCLQKQYPATLGNIRPGDLFAGRRSGEWLAYAGSIWWAEYPDKHLGRLVGGKQGGYCFDFAAVSKLAQNPLEQRLLCDLSEYWANECTSVKTQALWDDQMREYLSGAGQFGGVNFGFACALDIDRLLRRGIPGLIEDIEASQRSNVDGDPGFYEGLRIAMDVFVNVCRHYEAEARQTAERNPTTKRHYEEMAATLAAIVLHQPATLREAIQLAWLYILLTGGKHVDAPRLDVALGDFYSGDIDEERLSEQTALDLVTGLWQLFHETGEDAMCRIVIGGAGRRNEANADRFAMAAMEATRRFCKITPQLTLRIYKGQNPSLLNTAFDVLGEGCLYPMLYNDDVVIPGVAKRLGVPEEDAHAYHPLGCGEYMIAGSSPSLVDLAWSIPKSLEAVLHNGSNYQGIPIGPETGSLEPSKLSNNSKRLF